MHPPSGSANPDQRTIQRVEANAHGLASQQPASAARFGMVARSCHHPVKLCRMLAGGLKEQRGVENITFRSDGVARTAQPTAVSGGPRRIATSTNGSRDKWAFGVRRAEKEGHGVNSHTATIALRAMRCVRLRQLRASRCRERLRRSRIADEQRNRLRPSTKKRCAGRLRYQEGVEWKESRLVEANITFARRYAVFAVVIELFAKALASQPVNSTPGDCRGRLQLPLRRA